MFHHFNKTISSLVGFFWRYMKISNIISPIMTIVMIGLYFFRIECDLLSKYPTMPSPTSEDDVNHPIFPAVGVIR